MPVTVSWFDDKCTIVLYKCEEKWTWEEFNPLYDSVWNMIKSVNYRIDIIVDWTQSAGFPLGVANLIHHASTNILPEGEGLIICVGGKTLFQILLGAFRRLYPRAASAYRLVDSFEEAIKLLEQERRKPITQLISPFK